MVEYEQPSRAAACAPYWLIPIPWPQPCPKTLTAAVGVTASTTLTPPADGQLEAATLAGAPVVASADSGETTTAAESRPRARTVGKRQFIARGLLWQRAHGMVGY